MEKLFLYLLPVIVFFALLAEWYRFGRDPRKRKGFPIRYSPPKGITPAEAGTLIDELADYHDVIATLLDLAIRKHFVIEDTGDDFQFRLLQNYEEDPGLQQHESALLKSIFGRRQLVRASEIKSNFRHDLAYIKEELYEAVTKKRFFEKNPRKVRGKFMSWGLIFAFLTFLVPLGFGWLQYQGKILGVSTWHLFFAFLFSTFFFFIFSIFMPKKTKKGHDTYEQLLGLELFLQHPYGKPAGYAEEQTTFEKLLPYAVIFESLDIWTEVHGSLYSNNGPGFWKMSSGKISPAQLTERIRMLADALR